MGWAWGPGETLTTSTPALDRSQTLRPEPRPLDPTPADVGYAKRQPNG